MEDSFSNQVYTYVAKIPAGKVATYGDIAKALNRPGAARSVGSILKRNPTPFYKAKASGIQARRNDRSVPCHRVVRADRKLGGYSGGIDMKRKLLQKEGVVMNGNRVAPDHLMAKVQNPLAQW